MAKQDFESVGAVWKKKDKKGNVFFQVKFKEQTFFVFPNKNKESEKQPDFRISAAPDAQKPAPARDDEPDFGF